MQSCDDNGGVIDSGSVLAMSQYAVHELNLSETKDDVHVHGRNSGAACISPLLLRTSTSIPRHRSKISGFPSCGVYTVT